MSFNSDHGYIPSDDTLIQTCKCLDVTATMTDVENLNKGPGGNLSIGTTSRQRPFHQGAVLLIATPVGDRVLTVG